MSARRYALLATALLCGVAGCVSMTGRPGTAASAPAHTLRGVRAYGGDDESHLPIVLLGTRSMTGESYASTGDRYVTVEFDIDATIDPQLKLLVVHCSRDWKEDWAEFDDDFMHLQTTDVTGTAASPQVHGYGYHFAVRCPDPARRLALTYSGNYKMKIVEGEDTLGEARFYAVDPFANMAVRTFSEVDYNVSWHPQVHNVEVTAAFAPEVFAQSIAGMDLIIDHRVLDARRVDPGDTSSNVHVDEAGPVMRFIQYNIIPGNEYRVLDCRDPAVFPPSTSPISIVPRDIVRGGTGVNGDMHGSSFTRNVDWRYADYLPIRFRLDAMGKREKDVFLVGAFNDWHPDIDCQMDYDAREHSYVRVVWLKRGVHEYQYVTGVWNPRTRTVDKQSWSELEGNGWATARQYNALIYYRDTRYGGFDRIVGSGKNL